jgi:hypothetical protein
MLPNHRRYLIPSRPDPTRPRVKIQILAPQWSCHARPIYQKVLHTTGSRIMTSRHEASKTVRDSSDPAGDPCRTSPAHSVTNATNQKKGRDAQANRRGCQRAYEETSQLSRDKKRFHICGSFWRRVLHWNSYLTQWFCPRKTHPLSCGSSGQSR